ncbi:hypothetical protein ACFL6U_18965 [Planctomycetota bacterium]
MNPQPKKHRLNAEQSSRLLRLGIDALAESMDEGPDDKRRELLLDVLESKLPVDLSVMEMLPALLQSLSEELTSLSGPRLLDYLVDPHSRPVTLRQIKDYAKSIGKATKSEIENDVAMCIYYAAIGAALAFHGTKITGHSYKSMQSTFTTFQQKSWIPQSIKQLYDQAKTVCTRRAQHTG